ncbi:hypothetical protein O181_004481 [Austropuccinia psidii MF-1]|uniref:Integrase catalytic domain-containing protein n=1 Tax=Austropuccinia psidii MF-1 TaxID=1389203 RepID=A0A9Q3BGZ5_9BASI|nr:hypothetical protein [Austropuccinia psidii MF-1]
MSVPLGTSLKELRMDNGREFVSVALSNLGIGFHPSLPYLPQENGEAERLNCTLGDMARAVCLIVSGNLLMSWHAIFSTAC